MAAVLVLLAGLPGATPWAVALVPPPASDVPALRPPVPGPTTAGFDAPERYGPGHRGIDLRAHSGTPVTSPVAGRVHFAGSVVGLGWVTVAPTPRVLVTVGPLGQVGVRSGDVVAAGSVLGRALGDHDGRAALHLSLRVDGAYVDPAPHLRRTPPRATLVRVASRPARPGTAADTSPADEVPRSGAATAGVAATAGATVPWSRLR